MLSGIASLPMSRRSAFDAAAPVRRGPLDRRAESNRERPYRVGVVAEVLVAPEDNWEKADARYCAAESGVVLALVHPLVGELEARTCRHVPPRHDDDAIRALILESPSP